MFSRSEAFSVLLHVMAEGFDAERATALLIGSWKCERHRNIRGEEGRYMAGSRDGAKVSKKGGIKPRFVKRGGKDVRVAEAKWVEGDLKIMKRLLCSKSISTTKYDYREMVLGRAALGKSAVLKRIGRFFGEDKTYFILYFSGHGFSDGSWSFSRLTKKDPETVVGGGVGGATGVGQPGAAGDSLSFTIEAQSVAHPARDGSDVESGSEDESENEDEVLSEDETEKRCQPEDTDEWNELVRYEDIVQLWDNSKKGPPDQRKLMMILDCCFSGQWVRKVNGEEEMATQNASNAGGENGDRAEGDNGETRRDAERIQRRNDISIQAACGRDQVSRVGEKQVHSVFTKAFANAQNRSFLSKVGLTILDHILVLQVVSIATSNSFMPMSSDNPPFGGFDFFDSFDDMYLNT